MPADRTPHPSSSDNDRRVGVALRRAIGPVLVAGLLLLLGRRPGAWGLLLVAALLVALGLAWPAGAHRLDQAIARFAAWVGDALSVLISAVAWTVVVLPLWCASRIVRLSPLDPGWARAGSAWVTVPHGPDDEGGRARRMSTAELAVAPSIRRRRRARWIVLVLPFVVVGAVIATSRYDSSPTTLLPDDPDPGVPSIGGLAITEYAHEDEPWFDDYAAELTKPMNFWDPYLGTQLREMDGRYLNVVDGQRVSFQPEGAELEVWYFGGSTMFGIGQRDEHTIPSLIARSALEDGVRIRSRNFGTPAFVNWQETQQLAQALTVDGPPDLIVFYDGVNEWGLAHERIDRGDTDPSMLSRSLIDDRERAMYAQGRPPPSVPADENAAAVTLAGAQYARGVALGRELADSYGVPIAHFWQPMFIAKRLGPADQPLVDRLEIDVNWVSTIPGLYRDIAEGSGAEPIDLSTVLDDVDEPVFFDWGHTNERGARIIADEMYRHLRPTLAELQRAAGDGS